MAPETTIKVRALIGFLPGDPYPCFIGGMDATRWEVTGDDEWQAEARLWKEAWDRDWQSYDYREVFIEFPCNVAMVAPPMLSGVTIQPKEQPIPQTEEKK